MPSETSVIKNNKGNAMYTDTEGIILKQTKTVNGRRMILMFSKRFGKISAGTGISEKGRSKTALAMRPFTYGRYDLYKNRDQYNINGAEVLKSYYRIGEDVDKYMCCSYVLELTEKVLAEGQPAPELFTLLLDFFDVIEGRSKKHQTVLLAYEVKLLQRLGIISDMTACVCCGEPLSEEQLQFSVKDGGFLCGKCRKQEIVNDGLIYEVNFAIVSIVQYLMRNPLVAFRKLAIQPEVQAVLTAILKSYMGYHLDIGKLKSEGFTMEPILNK